MLKFLLFSSIFTFMISRANYLYEVNNMKYEEDEERYGKIYSLCSTMRKIGTYEKLDSWIEQSFIWQVEADKYMKIITDNTYTNVYILEASAKLKYLYEKKVNMVF